MSATLSLQRFLAFVFLTTLVSFANPVCADDDSEFTLTIGSKAPALDIEHWMSDGDGKFEHTTDLKSDRIYVVEFWATWCGPCIRSMPHLSETQEKFADKGVQIISISDETLEKVETFLEGDVRGQDDKTYAELTNNYCLTVDPDGSVMKDYFEAAGRTGIPCAFIVGKQGLVEWVGHPMQMDKPLSQVVEGTWDRAAFGEEFKEEQRQQAVEVKLNRSMQKIETMIGDGKGKEALKMVDDLIADEANANFSPMLANVQLQIVLSYLDAADKPAALKALVEKSKDDSESLNQIAWTIYEQHTEEAVGEELLKTATDAAEMAVKADPENGAVLDTLAHLLHANGDLDRAIEVQEKALANAGGQEAEIKPFLDELKAEKEKQE